MSVKRRRDGILCKECLLNEGKGRETEEAEEEAEAEEAEEAERRKG